MSVRQRLQVESLILDPRYQPRIESLNGYNISLHHAEQLMESEPADWPPIIVTPTTDGNYRVIDGFHRVAAARVLGLEDICATILPDAGYRTAFTANRAHGLTLSTADRKSFARWLHEHHPDWSYRQIGHEAGLSDKTVKRALQDGESTAETPKRSALTPERAASQLLRYASRLWSEQGLLSQLSEEDASREVAKALRSAIEDDPDRAEDVERLSDVLDAVLA